MKEIPQIATSWLWLENKDLLHVNEKHHAIQRMTDRLHNRDCPLRRSNDCASTHLYPRRAKATLIRATREAKIWQRVAHHIGRIIGLRCQN